MSAFNYQRGWRKAQHFGNPAWNKQAVIKSDLKGKDGVKVWFQAYKHARRDKVWIVRAITGDGLEMTLRGSPRAALIERLRLILELLYVGDLMEVTP